MAIFTIHEIKQKEQIHICKSPSQNLLPAQADE